jgi:transcriptional repressor NrdR
MKCPYCTSILSKVIDKRGVPGRGEIRRRRECLKCSKRYTTYEHIAEFVTLVVKRDGRKEVYNRDKLQMGLIRALQKRPGVLQASLIIDKIEARLRLKGVKEIPSSFLGRSILNELKKLDPVAYLRFASVYRKFDDPADFEKELEGLEIGLKGRKVKISN